MCSKVLKNTTVVSNGSKEITIDYEPPRNNYEKSQREINAKEAIESYENLAKAMLEGARKQKDQILAEAYREAEKIESEVYPKAYKEGFEKGEKEGYAEAYKVAYEENIKKANLEKEQLINDAQVTSTNIIKSAKEEYVMYLEDKKEEIRKLIKEITFSVLLKELKEEDGLNAMISNLLDEVKESKVVIIRCNSLHKNKIEDEISLWRNNNVFKGDIFLIEDSSTEEGNASIEKDNGKIYINIQSIIEKLDEIFNV
ncbi:FliH/SctL family protein [Clostridium malenominatum]|uniref:FliH/SctL family protein n=1 Tax=Clostridium malenominatum TaxID=1539 RepID=A0ABN1IYT0_9CLOT